MRAACVCACWPIGDAATATFFTPVTVSSHGIEGLARCCITAAIGVVRLELRGACTRPAAEELRCFAGVPLLMVVVVAVLLLLLLLLPFAADAERRALPRGADFVATGRSGLGCTAVAATAAHENVAAAAMPFATVSTAGGATDAAALWGACSAPITWTSTELLCSWTGTGSCRLPSWGPPVKAASATAAAASAPAQSAPAGMAFAVSDSRKGADGMGCEGETLLPIVPVRGPVPTLDFGERYCWVN
mmetsp:Transcript_77533/g.227348  ORF Transcript_77533/g.227348 Transcript_77533/m.227348 type:complete len:247 (-) Transcript_77533:155-895(-)